MPTLFTRIINGEIPGRFVWRDDRCVSFLTINPIRPGHTLVVPIAEVDHWLDLEPDLAGHLMAVSQKIGQAIYRAFKPVKVGVIIAGLEVPHTHIHLIPVQGLRDFDFTKQDMNPNPADLDRAAQQIRDAL